MKDNKAKPQRSVLAQQFKEKCKEILKQDPKNYLVTAFRDNQLVLDLTPFTPQDLPFFQIMTSLPIHKIIINTPDPNNEKSPGRNKSKDKDSLSLKIKTFPETPKFREFMAFLSHTIQNNSQLRSLRLERIPLTTRALKQLHQGLKKTQTLRELALVNCSLSDQHLEQIKASLAENRTLITLDLSSNQLCEVGGMIGHVLSEHSRRRNELIFFMNIRGQMPSDDLSNTGLCQVNLESNKLTDRSIFELTTSLKADSWTKCLNLRNNQIKSEGIREVALMLKNNTSLISLDLRGNQGLSKQYSKYIYKKLVLNMQKYKQQRQLYKKSKEKHYKTSSKSNRNSPQLEKQRQSIVESDTKYKSVRDNLFNRYQSKQYTTIAQPTSRQHQNNNMTLDRKIKINLMDSKINEPCSNCRAKTFEMLRLQKKTLDLQLQLRKVKKALLTNNIDISAIVPNNSQSVLEHLTNKSNENDDELLQRMEIIMLELTRVMETIDQHQHTKINLSNPLDNPNSFSNTVHLYDKNSGLQELGEEIEEEERLQAVFSQEQEVLGQGT